MAEESEKRFTAIMNKLFQTPPPKSKSTPTHSTSSSGVHLSRGTKRPNTVLEPKSGWQNSGPPPLCRPWDRGDLMRRLATFKSMTWFAKPQVVNAVNCARRGWINIETDTIACEACGARIFFSTPSSWTQHQVEKAALVFSLKLDSGHKLLCPWMDNACDESLAQFPPSPAAVLVDEYKKRSSALLHLLALPVISSSAIDYMRSPQLVRFLGGSSVVGCCNELADTSQTEHLGYENDANSSISYYKAQKIISLCGWEPRVLPFIVECKNQEYQSSKHANLLDSSCGDEQNCSIVMYSSRVDENVEANDDPLASGRILYDPNSVVLDCKFCGASVGLWTFSTVPRPLESLRLAGYTEVNGEDDSGCHKEDAVCGDIGTSHDLAIVNHVNNKEGTLNTPSTNTPSTTATSSSERQLNLKLTIAGGPPPAKQNFRATITLPVIGRNLRSRISSDPAFRERLCVNYSFQEGENYRVNTLSGSDFQPEDRGLLRGKQVDDGQCNSTSNAQTLCLNNDTGVQGDTLINDRNCDIASEGAKSSGQGFPETNTPDLIIENSIQSTPNLDESNKNEKLPENAENIAAVNPEMEVGSSSQLQDSSVATAGAQVTTRNGEIVEIDASMTVEASTSYLQHNPVTDTECSTLVDSQDGSRDMAGVQPATNDIVPWSIGKNLDQLPLDKAMEFDPIRQHRHFCPWIASTSNSPPGWQQTLSALQRQKEFPCPSSTDTPLSSLIEVDDPIESVKNLFMSPSAKRMKLTRGGSS